MKVLIVEDELFSAEKLQALLQNLRPDFEVLDVLSTVQQAVEWFKNNEEPDLAFLDIHLGDSSVFDLFDEIELNIPVIFTTAFDQYAIQAFKVNSVYYLLKPIDREELELALQKFESNRESVQLNPKLIEEMVQTVQKEKKRFLVKTGNHFISVPTEDIFYFESENKLTYLVTEKKRHAMDQSLEQLEGLLNPDQFFRINRNMLVSHQAIDQIHNHFNGRLKLAIYPSKQEEVLVSRERVMNFKHWLDS